MNRMYIVVVVLPILAGPLLAFAAFNRTMTFGTRGTDVISLQQTLQTLGYFHGTATGYFGPLTKAAVIAFQKSKSITPTGTVGPLTRLQLNTPASQPTINATSTVTITPTTSTSTGIIVPAVPPIPQATTTSASSTVATSTVAATSSMIVPPVTASSSSSTAAVSSSTSTSPVITVVSPPSVVPANTLTTTLSVTTDRSATCRWGTLPGMTIANMNAFLTTGGTSHSTPFVNLGPGYYYVYYVKCQDNTTNVISGDTTVSFSVASH